MRLWTRIVPAEFEFERLAREAEYSSPEKIVKNGTALGTGVGVEDKCTGDGFLVFKLTERDYIVYYWSRN